MIARAAAMSGAGGIFANGGNGFGPNFPAAACTDAAGGGGAGGTIVAAVNTGLAGRAVQAVGGNGANSSYVEHGPGGGGGGGLVYYNTTGGAPATSALGGTNGQDPNANVWFSTIGNGAVTGGPVPSFTSVCSTVLSVTKTNGTTSVAAGSTTSYTVTFVNSGSTGANGALASDPPVAGLACTVASCSANASPIAAACPLPAQWPNLLTPAGVALPTFPALSSVTFVLNYGVTATGLP